ncbi:MAG: F0F1 ATP synthase subunit delta [Candidatus Saccharimonadales bacterium]|jgi:F-type H+-transporting ATPase subunit delta
MLSRRRVTDYIARQLIDGVSAADTMNHLGAYLIVHKQTGHIDRYVADIEAALARYGQTVVDVTTARPLDAVLRDHISAMISGQTTIREHIDPDLIGGIIIKTPDSVLDASVRTQLRQLRTS